MKYLRILVLVLFAACVVAPVSAAAPAVKEWTWFVFLNADNNLDSFGVGDQNEMAKIGSNDFLNIVSLIDRENGPATLNYIEKGNVKKVKDLGEVDMGDYKYFAKMTLEIAKAYPAKHYAVIIWNHGSGWDKKGPIVTKGISYDDSTGNHITTEQLTLATSEIKKGLGKNLDVLGFDACLMAMMEVFYAVKDTCDYCVGSEETEPGEGYPYDQILKGLTKGMAPEAFVQHWVKAYTASYSGGSQGTEDCTQSAVACAKLGALKDAIDGFAKAAIAGSFGAQFKTALNSVQSFYISDNIDLAHFVSLLKDIDDAGLKNAIAKVEAAIKAAVVANGNNGYSMKNASGIAIFFPAYSYSFSTEYLKLAFAKDGMWDEMVQDFFKKSTNAIAADAAHGDLSSLISYVATANANNREISANLIGKLNFALFSEGTADAGLQASVQNLITELKAK